MTGNVVKLLDEKLFGFIQSDGQEYFFHKMDFLGHWGDLVTDFKSGGELIKVQFNGRDTAKGLRASNVNRKDFPNQAVSENATQ